MRPANATPESLASMGEGEKSYRAGK